MSNSTPRVVLGIYGRSIVPDHIQVHDAGAALVVDGELVAAINEERLSRIKNHRGFPHDSIDSVLELGGIAREEVDLIAMGGLDNPENGRRVLAYSTATLVQTGVLHPRRLGGGLRNLLLRRRRRLPEWTTGKAVRFVEHHQAHVASAYYASPWTDATIITVDGVGDEVCATVSEGRNGRVRRLNACNGYHSPGVFFSAITVGLGFSKNRHEGKITGLAAHGDPEVHGPAFRQVLQYQSERRRFFSPEVARIFRNLQRNTPFFDKLLNGGSPENIAAAAQQILEEVVVPYCRDGIRETGISNVVLAGGVFANVKLNQRIRELDEVDNMYVHPNMGDGGLAAGAALQVFADENQDYVPKFLPDVYLGPEWDDAQVQAVLDRENRSYSTHENIENLIADLLIEGKIIGRFDGRMEYGPRALGNRSILAQPTDTTVNDWLNVRLKRTEFMPFAPSTLEEKATEHYVGWHPDHVAARFMTITYDATPKAVEQAPATVHVDNTARPQIVRRQDNRSYHEIIRCYFEKTGIPSIINTSFNMHEEPIVCRPEDALRALDEGGVDLLAINRFLVESRAIDSSA